MCNLQGSFLSLSIRRPAMQFPRLMGDVMIRNEDGKIIIAGDPDGLRSLGRLLAWLAEADQEHWPYLRVGDRAHVHLYPKNDLKEGSTDVELMRLDAKGG
jgi:hypothetical protein